MRTMAGRASLLIRHSILGLLMCWWTHGAAQTPVLPIVFLPGLLGSELRDVAAGPPGEVMWGEAWSIRKIARLRIPDGPRKPTDQIKAIGAIKAFSIFGPFEVKQYSTMFSYLESIGYSQGNGTLVVCPYDWRQSNFDSARDVGECIDEQLGATKEFDLVAHSMGGLVALAYIDRLGLAKASRVKSLTTLATPFQGSAAAIETLFFGWGLPEFLVPGGTETVKLVAASFPSLYELVPTFAGCCMQADNSFSFLNEGDWAKIKWPVKVPQADLSAALRRASQLRDIARKASSGALNGVPIYTIAGNNFDTKSRIQLVSGGALTSTQILHGDGNVPLISAANSDVARSAVAFAQHQRIFEDAAAEEAMYRVFRRQRLNSGQEAETAKAIYPKGAKSIDVDRVSLKLENAFVQSGSSAKLILMFDSSEMPPESLEFEGFSFKRTQFEPVPGPAKSYYRAAYASALTVPQTGGAFSVEVNVGSTFLAASGVALDGPGQRSQSPTPLRASDETVNWLSPTASRWSEITGGRFIRVQANASIEEVQSDLDEMVPSGIAAQAICPITVSGIEERGEGKRNAITRYGTAFLVSTDRMLTALHTVDGKWAKDEKGVPLLSIEIQCSDDGGNQRKARARKLDAENDVALLEVLDSPFESKSILECASRDTVLRNGTIVWTFGYPTEESALGESRKGISAIGIVSSYASITPGNVTARYNAGRGFSGSPVMIKGAHVVGIHVGSNLPNQGLYSNAEFVPLKKVPSLLDFEPCRSAYAEAPEEPTCRQKCEARTQRRIRGSVDYNVNLKLLQDEQKCLASCPAEESPFERRAKELEKQYRLTQ